MHFPTWDELSELQQLQCIYSDDYKDEFGFRPRPSELYFNDVEWLKSQIEWLHTKNDPWDE
jgi:hypothetical protein